MSWSPRRVDRRDCDTRATLHKLWTAAVGTPGYRKRDWLCLERMIRYFDRRRASRDRRVDA